MFNRTPKHVFTCPDVIYLNAKTKRHNRNTLIGILSTYALIFVGGWIASVVIEKKEAEESAENNGETYDLSDYAEQR